MLNIDQFTNRLEELFKKYELTPSTFADKIGVQRSSISHLLSGRNKPSLDFVLKVQEEFPDVELNWLLHGKGNFEVLTTSKVSPTPPNKDNLFSQVEKEEIRKPKLEESKIVEAKPLNQNVDDMINISNSLNGNAEDELGNQVDKIVIFYKNGTFKSFKPE